MRLINRPGRVALRAHSVKLWSLSVLCLLGTIGDAWQFFDGILPISQTAFAVLGLLFGIAGLAGRFIDQDL